MGGRSGESDVLGARSLGTLALLERDGLPFAEIVEAHALAG